MGRPSNTVEDFERYYVPEPNSGCWLWTGETGRGGYGRFWSNYERRWAHHVALKCDVPDGHIVIHSCDTPCCVNPDHLRIGTHKDNQADAIKRGRHTWGKRHGAAKLTEDQVREIRASSGNQVEAAKKYGVTQALISAIRAGKTWKYL
jgi:hypothetical protein